MPIWKRLRGKQALAVLTSLALITPISQAQEDTPAEADTTRPGPYVGIGVSGGIPAFDGGKRIRVTTPSNASIEEETSAGVNARAGYRFLSFLAAEVQYEWIDQFDIRTRGQDCAKVKAQVLTGNLKLFAPYHSFHPYALAGIGTGRYEQKTRNITFANGTTCEPAPGKSRHMSNWEFAARFGVGIDLYLNERIVVNLETSGVYSEERTLHHSWPFVSINAGLQYRF